MLFPNRIMYWVYLDETYDEYAIEGYMIYQIDVIHNKWGFSFRQIANIITLTLVDHDGNILCLCWDACTSVQCIEHVPNFQQGHPPYHFSHTQFEDEFKLSWKYMDHLKNDINENCQGYTPFRSMNEFVLMYKYVQVTYRKQPF